jgi:hypothetical protein
MYKGWATASISAVARDRPGKAGPAGDLALG